MITPTRTVCYAEIEHSKTWHKVLSDEGDGLKVEVDHKLNLSAVWSYGYFSRIIAREEPIEQYHPWMVHTGDFSDLKIEPGEIKRYPATECAKKFFLNADCLCEGCAPNLWPRHHLFMRSLLEKDMVRYKKEPKS